MCAPQSFCVLIDSNGKVVVQYYYDAWGNHTVSGSNTTLGNLNPFRYRGYYYDTETGLYFLQTRYYDPEVGRFLNRDAVTYADPETIGGLNLYAYCLNNPVMYSDPTGHAPWWDWLLAGIVIIGSAIAAPLTMGTSIYVGGAFAAIAIGGTISVVNQVATTGDLDIDRFTVDVIGSAISGGLAATGLGLAEQIFGNIAIGAGNGLLYSGLSKEPITVESGIDNILSGFIGGVTGWKGVQFLSGKMTMYQLAERNQNIAMSLIVALSRSNLSNIIYSIISNLF